MAARGAGKSLRVEGELAIARVLTAENITGRLLPGRIVDAASVLCSDAATIQIWSGGALVRTKDGSLRYGRPKTDTWVYVLFIKPSGQNPCVLHIKQILLAKKPGMGWPNDEARLAVETLYDRLHVAARAGLETKHNDDPKTVLIVCLGCCI